MTTSPSCKSSCLSCGRRRQSCLSCGRRRRSCPRCGRQWRSTAPRRHSALRRAAAIEPALALTLTLTLSLTLALTCAACNRAPPACNRIYLQARAECEELRRELGAAEARGAAAAEAARRVCREAEAMVGEREAATQHGQSATLGSALARRLCLLRARRAPLGSSALPGRGSATGRPATALGARASRLQSRRFHFKGLPFRRWSCCCVRTSKPS